jgi:hypothetical protein
MINKCTIYGERCSGTTYLEDVIQKNFNIEIVYCYGWKHFFGFESLFTDNENVLFICIVRDLYEWLNSFYREQHHLPLKYITDISEEEKIDKFLNNEFYSVNDCAHNYKTWTTEILYDRNIYTRERYKNIFELRHIKIKYMLEDLPKKVKNYIFIKYEDLINDFENTMIKIRNCGLEIKEESMFPKNTDSYKKNNNLSFREHKKEKKNVISKEMILHNPNLIREYEEKLGYI